MFFVRQCSRFLTHAGEDSAAIKTALKEKYAADTRRISRLTALAVAGIPSADLPPDTSVYLASSFSSPHALAQMFRALFTENAPQPFEFMSNLNNAPLYCAARIKHLQANAAFLAAAHHDNSWLQPLLCALADLAAGKTRHALAGWCHAHKPGSANTTEGSHWLWLSADAGEADIARCAVQARKDTEYRQFAPAPHGYYWQNIADFFAALENEAFSLPALPQTQLTFTLLKTAAQSRQYNCAAS